MHRLLVNLLVALALLMQTGGGVLAAGGACCGEVKVPVKRCCAGKVAKTPAGACPCHPERDRCGCAATGDSRAMPVAGPRTVNVPGEFVALPPEVSASRCYVIERCTARPCVRVNESPPRSTRAMSLPLLL